MRASSLCAGVIRTYFTVEGVKDLHRYIVTMAIVFAMLCGGGYSSGLHRELRSDIWSLISDLCLLSSAGINLGEDLIHDFSG